MALSFEEKVMLNVLRAISKGQTGSEQAPDEYYLKALETIGYIKIGWDTSLTSMGQSWYEYLLNKSF